MNRLTPFLHNYASLARSFSKFCLGPLATAIFLNLVSASEASAQISLFNQFIGDYDYVVTGGTLRTQPNTGDACAVTNTNTEVLSGIPPTATVTAAYLYWAGSQGPAPDYDITFEGQSLSADRTFTDSFSLTGFPTFNWFQGFKDVTSIVAAKGNGSYTFSDLTVDTGTTNPSMCTIQGVLSGWSLFVVYEDSTTVTQTNAINIYDGFSVSRNTFQDFTLSGILVSDNPVAKFTSLLWEGDQNLGGLNEFFSFEGNTLSDSANPANNPFNSSINSLGFGADTVYGVDLDTFDVSSFTSAGSTSVTGRVSSNDDLVILAASIVGVSVASADLEVTKTVDNASPSVGDTITYSITVTNQGDNNASGVVISDVLPPEVTYLSSSGPGTYNANSGDWTIGNLNVGVAVTLQVSVQVDSAGNFSNTASVKASSLLDPDSTPGNADPAEDDQDSVTVTATATPVVSISGNLYVDSNGNDLYEDSIGGGSEAPLPENITVRLLSSDGTTELATTVTDINGFYSFPNLAPDTYQVVVETTDPDIPTGLNSGTPTPLTVSANGGDVSDQDFGFDIMTTGAGVSFCENPNGEVYSGGISNDIYGIYPPTGATFRITSSALARVVNSLATDHVNRVVYYAEGQAIYAWDPINDIHVRLQDSSGNLNVSSMLGGGSILTLTSGGGAFYNGSLYLGIEQAQGNSDTDVYRVDFVPGSNGLTIQSLTALGTNDNTGGANGGLSNADWGDMIISDTGILYGATRIAGSSSGTFWSFDLNTSTYSFISGNYLGQLAKDGDGTLWGLSDTGRIQEVDVNTGSLFGPSSPTSSAIADMGECVIGFSTIGDRVWDDLDGDGVQDTLEPGIANVTVGLYRDLTGNGVIDGNDPLLTTQVTNVSGNYDFVDLIPGTYIVRILEGTADDLDGTNVLDGSVLTTTGSTPGGRQAVNLPLGIVDYNDADFGYQLPVIPQNPNVLLVKRITQINNDTASAGGDDLAGYINQDDVTNPYDDNDITVADPVNPTDPPKDTDQWPDPTTNLIGGIDGGNVMPNDEIEYTIYYLSSGDATAESVLFCDYVPTFTSFTPNGYNGSAPQATGGIGGADLSIELFRNGSTDYHTGANDGDSATYFAPGVDPAASFPGIDCDGDNDGINTNTNGAVVVNLGDLPDATTDTVGAYGYVRFRTRVK